MNYLSMKDRTIVHMITGLGGGGAEHMVLKLGLEAQKANIKTLVVSISDINTIEQKFIDAEIPYHFLDIKSFFSFWRGLRKLKKILSNENEIVVHCHMFHALFTGVVFSLLYRTFPIVFTLHNTTAGHKYRELFLRFTKRFRKADIIFSKSGTQSYLKKCVVIPNGLDISNFEVSREFNPTDSFDKNFRFLFLGSLTEQKNPLSLIDLTRDLLDAGLSDFAIDVVGEGPMRALLEQGIQSEGYQQLITLHGFSTKVVGFLKSSHCLIMPSHWEGMPVVILEAGAARLPIISTPVGSIPDILKEEDGYLEDLSNFSEAMKSVILDYETALKKSNSFYNNVVANYSIQEVFKKHLELYYSI